MSNKDEMEMMGMGSYRSQDTNRSTFEGYDNKWLEAISDAEDQIRAAKLRIAELKGAIQVFRDRYQSGESFPTRVREGR